MNVFMMTCHWRILEETGGLEHLLSGGRREARRRVDCGCLELARTYVVQYICTILEAHTCIMRGFVGGGLLN